MLKFYVQFRCTPKRLIHAAAALALSLGCFAQNPAEPAANPASAEAGQAGSEAAPASDEATTHLLDSEALWMQDYMASMPAKDALWLGEGETPFIAFSQPAVNPKQLGILLLGSSPADLTGQGWQRHLYDNLPLHGWSALATLVPPANAASDDQQKAQTRLRAATAWLLDQGARSFTIVGDEDSIQVAVNSCIANAENCSGIVLWRVAEAQLQNLELENLQQSRVSVLDVLDGQPHGNMRLRRKRHFDAAGFDNDYRPIVIPQADNAATWALASKRLRHWLDSTFASE
ncbi:MAG: alpha/beta hydrolase family protein [Gammaproteobacteria bacterium]|nr:alpha/beta hydrolase family protein [Gammaproteobacteria bacterium]NND38231.1 hypothetical protein [Pseudomonadales bacterium]NNM12037.1 hypothetical protein [Pseudomonadales bacterium]